MNWIWCIELNRNISLRGDLGKLAPLQKLPCISEERSEVSLSLSLSMFTESSCHCFSSTWYFQSVSSLPAQCSPPHCWCAYHKEWSWERRRHSEGRIMKYNVKERDGKTREGRRERKMSFKSVSRTNTK